MPAGSLLQVPEADGRSVLKESMCDRCMSPGACCKRLSLSGVFSQPMSLERVEHLLVSPEWFPQTLGVFRPGGQTPDGRWEFWCTALDSSGRCSIYEDRPQLCRHYRPGHDAMCVHFWQADSETTAVKNATGARSATRRSRRRRSNATTSSSW
jgi:Fe-S-cluster containining protein